MKLSIVFFNDVHGYLQSHPDLYYEGSKELIKTVGGYARIAGYVNQVRKSSEHVLVFDGGDTFHGTYPVVQSKGEMVVPILNKIGIDAMVGHWDFAYGPEQLLHLASQLNYPVLGINVYKGDGNLFLLPYKIVSLNGIKVAIIGICSNVIDKTMPAQFSEGLRVSDGQDELPGYIEKVKSEGADLVILLSHNGFPQDCHMLSHVEGVDICLSAHTHNRLYEAVTIKNTVVIQCGCHGSFIGQLDLEIEDKTIQSHSYHLLPADEKLPIDEEMDRVVNGLLKPYDGQLKELVGQTPVNLHRYDSLNSGMDNLLVSAIMYGTHSELAFSNGWRYGAPIKKGSITKNDLFNIIPHNPFISTTDLTGREIKRMLEENLERTFSCEPMQQMGGYVKRCAGLTAYIKIENPEGHRIQELFIGDSPYDSAKVYHVAFVTEQGVPEKYGSNSRETDVNAVNAMVEYLKAGLFTIEVAERKSFIAV